jgi:hypothetical protein
MFEAMTTEGRLSVIQKKRLCQFCLRHPDTQPCPSHSLPEEDGAVGYKS